MLPKFISQHHLIILITLMLMFNDRIGATKLKNNTATMSTFKANQGTLMPKTLKELPELSTTDSSEWPEFPPKLHKKITTTMTTKSPNFTLVATTASTTTTAITITTKESPSDNSNGLPENNLNNLPYCSCDVSLNSCDINCCCDPDCNSNILKAFQCNQEHQLINQQQHKPYEIESCDTSDSWFCLFHSNIPRDDTNKLLHEEYFDTKQFYTWPDPFLSFDDDSLVRDFYKFGDPIKLINLETKAIKVFELPASHISPHYSPYCNTKVTVEHLKSFQKYCRIRNMEELREIQEYLINLEKFYNMAMQPPGNSNEFENLITNIQVKYCYSGNKTCNNITKQKEEGGQEEEEEGDKIIEQYRLIQVNIKILHNYTQIKWCLLELWFKEIDFIVDIEEEGEGQEGVENLKETEWWLQWNVLYHNETYEELMAERGQETYNKIVSGPLGYLLHKPIIISTYEEDPNLLITHKTLKYFHKYTEMSAHIFKLFTMKRGKCYRPIDKLNTINYGINEILSCTIVISNDSNITPLIIKQMENANAIEKYDFTGICNQIQNIINYQLVGDSDDRNTINMNNIENWFVSKWGRPSNTTTDWLPLLIKNIKSMPIFGHYNEPINTITCHNMLLNLNYEFHTITQPIYNERVAGEEIGQAITSNAQHIIERATLIFGQRHTLEFKLHEQFEFEIPLAITIRFYNLNNENIYSRANTLLTLYTFLYKIFNFLVESFISYL